MTLEVQQREADQLKQLQSEFKSEIEIERNRQDRCLKKMLVPDEEVPAFQLNEVEEISFTDGKSMQKRFNETHKHVSLTDIRTE